eukprot:4439962-Amphidinium_carterae.1
MYTTIKQLLLNEFQPHLPGSRTEWEAPLLPSVAVLFPPTAVHADQIVDPTRNSEGVLLQKEW